MAKLVDGPAREQLVAFARGQTRGAPDVGERDLSEQLLLRYVHPEFPYAVAAEWDFVPNFTNLGRGDIVFASQPCKYRDQHGACRVLVVEVKYFSPQSTGRTARTKRRQGRKKVREQVVNAMQAWHGQHPRDDVFGATCINGDFVIRSRQEWLHSVGEDPSDMEDPEGDDAAVSMTAVLQLELVPLRAWAVKHQPKVPLDMWERVRNHELARAAHQCEICRVSHQPDVNELVIHQKWRAVHHDHDTHGDLCFEGFEVLCWCCHDVKHFGWAQGTSRRRGLAAFNRLQRMRPDLCDQDTGAQRYVQEKFDAHAQTAFVAWHIDDSSLYGHPAVALWLVENDQCGLIKYGNVCCKAEYNTQPPAGDWP
eukprot:c40405_g1_i1.p1 GENE.c40405_g1_i1~~c40405_g1_i1.p1  ORF type:complete len:366 (+),score=27.40 c40405_g1_i1:73-1170(+)